MMKSANDNRRRRRDLTALLYVVWVSIGIGLMLVGVLLAVLLASFWPLIMSAIGGSMLYFADQ